MYQPPDTLIGRLSDRDARSPARDSIKFTPDTSGEERYGFWFGVNRGDALMDGRVLPERNFSREPLNDARGALRPIAKPDGPGARPSYDFAVSQYAFQARYRWEFAPLSEVFLVYTRQADLGTALDDASFGAMLDRAWSEPLVNVLVFKLRYRFGS